MVDRSRSLVSFAAGVASASLVLTLGPRLVQEVHRWWKRQSSTGSSRRRVSGRQVPLVKRRPRAVCFGDSITQFGFSDEHKGWVGLLADHYSRKLDVVNRGFSGYNTRWLRVMLEDLFGPQGDDLAAHPPLLVTVCLGANDATLPGQAQHVPFEEYKENLRAIALFFQRLSPDTTVVIITPPPLHEADWAAALARMQRGPLDRSHSVSRLYGEAAKQVGQELRLPVVDAYHALTARPTSISTEDAQQQQGAGGSSSSAGGPEEEDWWSREHLCDGLHLSASGNRRLMWELVRVVQESAPWLAADEMDMQGPDWTEIRPTTTHPN